MRQKQRVIKNAANQFTSERQKFVFIKMQLFQALEKGLAKIEKQVHVNTSVKNYSQPTKMMSKQCDKKKKHEIDLVRKMRANQKDK